MPRTSKIMVNVKPGAEFKRGDSVRRVLEVEPIRVTYKQLTSVRGPGQKGDERTVSKSTFYNWVRLAMLLAPEEEAA